MLWPTTRLFLNFLIIFSFCWWFLLDLFPHYSLPIVSLSCSFLLSALCSPQRFAVGSREDSMLGYVCFPLTGNSRFEESDFQLWWRNGVCAVLFFIFFLFWEVGRVKFTYPALAQLSFHFLRYWHKKNEEQIWWWTSPSKRGPSLWIEK